MLNGWTVVALCIIAMAVYAWITERRIKMIKRKRFAGRQAIAPDAFYDLFYRESGLSRQAVTRALVDIAGVMELDHERLRPSDELAHELAEIEDPLALDCSLEEIESYVAGRIGRATAGDKLQHVKTLNDLIVLLAQSEALSNSENM